MDKYFIERIFEIVKDKMIIDKNENIWSNRGMIYFEELKKELDEVKIELDNDKQCYLEDELGDVLWDYLNLLYNLESEGKISKNKVFERAFNKYSERVGGVKRGVLWEDIKKVQKERLKVEQIKKI